MSTIKELLERVGSETQSEFQARHSVLTFAEWVTLLKERPYTLSRSAPQYIRDMMLHFGVEQVPCMGGMVDRFLLFDGVGESVHRVVGQEAVQVEIFNALCEFVQRGISDRLVMLHGPNGAAKSSIVRALMEGLEVFSVQDEGPIFTFNWIFSEAADRGERLGFDPVRPEEDLASFAKLDPDRISAKIPSDFGDSPLFLIPREQRLSILQEFVDESPGEESSRFSWTRYLLEGELSPKSKAIHDALLSAYSGDWEKVMRHVQVERVSISKRYRRGAVTIEPQQNVDAQSREIGHPNMSGLPPVLQNLALFEARGDLVDGNNGIVEYSDFFKRQPEANKYLLTTAENAEIHLESINATLNCLLIGTSNEDYLSEFRKQGMYSSLMARFQLIRVPYVLEFEREAEIYRHHLQQLPDDVHVPAKTPIIAAKWAVMTRLMAPTAEGGSEVLREAVKKLKPLQKAHLYNSGRAPSEMTEKQRRELFENLMLIRREYDSLEVEFDGRWDAGYEGRRGCSPREMLTVMSDLAIFSDRGCLTPESVMQSLRELLGSENDFDFLRMTKTSQGFHDPVGFLTEIEDELLQSIAKDVFEASELIEPDEFKKLFTRYFDHVKAHATKEKVAGDREGTAVDPDQSFMRSVEDSLGIEEKPDVFRSTLMTRVASFRLDNPDVPIVPTELFDDYIVSLRKDYFSKRLGKIRKLVGHVNMMRSERGDQLEPADAASATRLWDRMLELNDYCEVCLQESLNSLLNRFGDLQSA